MPNRPHVRLAVVLATCLLTAACGSDSSGPGDQGDLVCTGVSFAQNAGVPLDEIAVGRLPADFEEPFAARILGTDGAAAGHALVRAAESGELGAIADALRDVLRSQAALLGTTPEALSATALAENPSIEDSLEIQVGGCSCSASISVGGEVSATTFLRFFLTPDLTGVQSFDWRGGTDESPSQVTFGFGGSPVSPITVPLPNVGGFDAYGSGVINGRVFMNPDDFDEPTLSPLSLSLSENTGSRFVGSVTGTVSMAADPEFQNVPLFLTFAIEADPFLSSDDVKMCEVVQ